MVVSLRVDLGPSVEYKPCWEPPIWVTYADLGSSIVVSLRVDLGASDGWRVWSEPDAGATN
ncbi:Hypothetical protein MVR_LOCUS109 [uncultured virus]|nr:Hypothetical protein MVR_LOCUS109 [uncultured virus]